MPSGLQLGHPVQPRPPGQSTPKTVHEHATPIVALFHETFQDRWDSRLVDQALGENRHDNQECDYAFSK